MAQCVKCSDSVPKDKEVVCALCKGSYHPECLSPDTLETYKKLGRKKNTWKCETCVLETVSSASKSDHESGLVLESIQKLRVDLNSQFQQVNLTMEGIKSELVGVNTTIASMQSSVNLLVQENETRKTEIGQAIKQNDQLAGEVSKLQLQVHELEQYSRRDNVVIAGVPYSSGENVYELIEKLSCVIEIQNFQRYYISVAHRLPTPVGDRRPPLIIARFISRENRNAWMRAAWKCRRGLTAAALSDSWPSTPVYVNDHLTGYFKTIFNSARSLVKEKKIASVWTRDSRVFARRSAESPVRLIRTMDDLAQVLKDP